MDQLSEPLFTYDKDWKRKITNVDDLLKPQERKKMIYFVILSSLSTYRYVREITFYKRNYLTSLIVVPLLIWSSYQIAEKHNVDPYLRAAQTNNADEQKFFNDYKTLYREVKQIKGNVPDKYIF